MTDEQAAKVLTELLRRFEATIPTPLNHRGESTMRIEHFVDLVHEAKQAIAALSGYREATPQIEYSMQFMDGWLEGEGKEALRNWQIFRAAALAAMAQP